MTNGPDRPRARDRLLGGLEDDAASDADRSPDAKLVGDVLRRIRVERRIGVGEVAVAMGMPRSSYEYGVWPGRISYDKIERFARAVDADPVAILATIVFRSSDPALLSVDNKLFMIAFIAVAELLDELGGDIEKLDARTIIAAFEQLTKGLTEAAHRRDNYVEDWFSQRSAALGISLGGLFGRKRRK